MSRKIARVWTQFKKIDAASSREMRDRKSELLEIPGVGERTRQRLLQHFGSVRAVQQADAAALGAVLTKPQAEAVLKHFQKEVG